MIDSNNPKRRVYIFYILGIILSAEELEDASGYDYGFYTTEHTHAWVRCDVVRLV